MSNGKRLEMGDGKGIIYHAEEEIRRMGAGMAYKLVLLENHEDNIIMRDGKVEKMLRATSLSLAINLYIDGRDGFFYTNDLRCESVSRFLREAVETTRLLEPDESRTLADPERYYKGGGPDLKNFDASLSEIDPKEKIRLLSETAREIEGTDRRIISMQTRYMDRQHQAHYLISNGFDGYEESSYCTLTSLITVEGERGQHPMDGWGESRLFFNQMPRTGIAPIALRRTLSKIGQRPAPTGRYRMILESPCAGNFLQPILNAMNGQALQQRTSFLWGKLGEQVLSPLVNIIDDPLQPGTRGASLFDYDGVATRRRELFIEGRLQTYFIDTTMGRKLGMEPTTQGIHRLIMVPSSRGTEYKGSEKEESAHRAGENKAYRENMEGEFLTSSMLEGGLEGEILASSMVEGGLEGNFLASSVWRGMKGSAVLVTDFNGGNCDPVTGNFSYGIEGFLIKDGEIVQPVSGMNVTGNMLDVWQRLSHVADDADPWEMELIPTLTFEDVAFSGC